MWGQSWENILDITIPYPGKNFLDVTPEMLKQVCWRKKKWTINLVRWISSEKGEFVLESCLSLMFYGYLTYLFGALLLSKTINARIYRFNRALLKTLFDFCHMNQSSWLQQVNWIVIHYILGHLLEYRYPIQKNNFSLKKNLLTK